MPTDKAGLTAMAARLTKPFSVFGEPVTESHIRAAINRLANLPERFQASDLLSVMPDDPALPYLAHEATNRLMQRWRKLGLAVFEKSGRWRLTQGSWERMQRALASKEPTDG